MKSLIKKACLTVLIVTLSLGGFCSASKAGPIRVMTDLNIGETQEITLNNGQKVRLELLAITEKRDDYRQAIRDSEVKVMVDGDELTLHSGNYNLPVTIGNVQIDCPVIRNYYSNSNLDRWGLEKDARFRLWPGGSPWLQSDTFVYPVKQEWLASFSQSGNEPTFVDWGESRSPAVYYHSGFDIGGAEGMDEIVSATDGVVLSANSLTMEGQNDFFGDVRPDVVYIRDNRGWVYRYSHLDSVFAQIIPGARVKAGEKVGFMGKQGQSGGWVHLHFEIRFKDEKSGKWIAEDPYAYAWEAFCREYNPAAMAVARPHRVAWAGSKIRLDGSKSMSLDAEISSWEWQFSDGTTASGPVTDKVYSKPGEYSELLKVTDSNGNVDFDFAVVQIFGKDNDLRPIPTIHAAFHPTRGIRAGDPVTFLVRTFNATAGNEIWDFGDGSPVAATCSEPVDRKASSRGEFARISHTFSRAGSYIVRVKRENEHGYSASALLHVVVHPATEAGDPPVSDDIPPFFCSKLSDIEACLNGLKKGKTEKIAVSPGGLPVYAVYYGEKEDFQSQANYNSAVAAGNPAFFAGKTPDTKPVVLFLGPVHGQEVEGIVGLLNLIRIAETGKDMRGREWPALKSSIDRSRVVIIPCGNPDGRKRVPYSSFIGLPIEVMTKYGQGTKMNGDLWRWPHVKAVHPLKGDVKILGGYFNDNGINLMHDDFFFPMAEETKGILKVARDEVPDMTVSLHSCGYPPSILMPAYEPVFIKERVAELANRLNDRYKGLGLPYWTKGLSLESVTDDAKFPPKRSFNLTSALHHVSGSMAFTFECYHGTVSSKINAPAVTFDDILDIQLNLYQEMFDYLFQNRLYWEK